MPSKIMHVWDAELGYSTVHLANRPPGGPVEIPPGTTGGEPVWGVWAVDPGGREGVWLIQHSQMEWHSSAYAIDPEDVATLLDVAFHEWFLPNPNDPLALQDLVAAQILRETSDFPSVWTPGVPDEARREAHLERIRLVKERIARVEAAPRQDRQDALLYVGSRRVAPADPLEPIKTQTRLDPVRVAGKRAYLEWRRATADGPVTPAFELKPPATFTGMVPG
ncbi:hypothetical protein [Nonomuraea rubra]|uniref:hypothetical protein n=1 Tax=Nonomuraea rubra TaxID=46180 RepID=UPI003406034B